VILPVVLVIAMEEAHVMPALASVPVMIGTQALIAASLFVQMDAVTMVLVTTKQVPVNATQGGITGHRGKIAALKDALMIVTTRALAITMKMVMDHVRVTLDGTAFHAVTLTAFHLIVTELEAAIMALARVMKAGEDPVVRKPFRLSLA
jgi:hypothetical protein